MAGTFTTSREIGAPVAEVFAAFSDPVRLARWWGPVGFTNTFMACEFRAGGQWSYVMHDSKGKDYPNESVFAEVEAPVRIVIRHISQPRYVLTIRLAASGARTTVSWSQAFENERTGSRLARIIVPAN
jgi:uncharacterized protein YndB with AHSA1/START domain